MASSRDYWRDREADWAIEYANNQAQWDAKISEIYTDLQNRMVEEINNWYMRFADKHGLTLDQARHLVSIADQDYYANRAKYFVGLAGQDMQSHSTSNAHIYFSDAANKEMSLYNTTMRISRMKVLQSMLNIHIASAVGQTHQAMGTCLSQHAMQVLLDRAKVLGPTVMNNMSRIPALVNASFHGATFSSRLWNTHQQNLQNGIQSALARGLILGEHPERFRGEIVKESQLKTRAAFKAARTLLNTEFCRVQTSAEILAYKTEGFKEYMYIANERCCEDCQDLDGNVYKVKDESAGQNLPPMHPNCRCSTAPYSDREEYEKWLDGYKDHGMTWEEWKEQEEGNESLNERTDRQKVEIDQKAIDQVPCLRLPGWTEEKAKEVQAIHKELLMEAMLHNESNEVGQVLSNGQLSNFVHGSGSEVDFGKTGLSNFEQVFHNHPRCTSFSLIDLSFFASEDSLELLTIVKNNGKVELLEKTPKFAREQLSVAVDKAFKRVMKGRKTAKPTDQQYDAIVKRTLITLQSEGALLWGKG